MACTATSSGLKSAAGVIAAMPARLLGVLIVGGSAQTTVTIYDNATAASGTVLAKGIVAANTTLHIPLQDAGVASLAGLYCDISGTAGAAIVYYALS